MNKLHVITDSAGVVVDIASEHANLSRGYTFPGFKEYTDLDPALFGGLQIGDSFNGVTVTVNAAARQARLDAAANEAKVQARMRALAIADLKSKSEIPADYQ